MGQTLTIAGSSLSGLLTMVDCGIKVPPDIEKATYSFFWKCPTCSEKYSEDLPPRNLKCGHSQCTKCVRECVDGLVSCSECQMKQSLQNIDGLPVNYPLLRFVSSLQGKDIFREVKLSAFTMSDYLCSNSEPIGVIQCKVHSSPVLYFCYTCDAWICKDCLILDHCLVPRGSCRTIEFEHAKGRMRKEYEEKISKYWSDVEKFKMKSEFDLAMHTFCMEHCLCNRRIHDRYVNQIEGKIEEYAKNNLLFLETVTNKIEKLRLPEDSTESLEKLEVYMKDTLAYQSELEECISRQENELLQVVKIILRHLRMTVKLQVQRNRTIYAKNDQGTKWAPVTVKEDRLLLYSLREGTVPREGFVIPYEYVRKLVSDEITTVFLEVGTKEETKGIVHIRLTGYDKASVDQMALMCSGEKDVSYRGTSFYRYDKECDVLEGGDYENNDGTGGRPVVIGLGQNDQSIDSQMIGALVCDPVSTRFSIRLKRITDDVEGLMGKVIWGMKSLRDVTKLQPVTQSLIKDCGLFIRMEDDQSTEE